MGCERKFRPEDRAREDIFRPITRPQVEPGGTPAYWSNKGLPEGSQVAPQAVARLLILGFNNGRPHFLNSYVYAFFPAFLA